MRNLLASLLLVAGCASSGAIERDESRAVSALTVNNQRGEDVAVYVMHSGIRGRRLGQVIGYGSATFALSASDAPLATGVQFFARAIVSGAMDLSDPIDGQGGVRYEWKIGPAKNHDYVTLHYARI